MDSAQALGLARSLAIYYGRPWRQRALGRFYRGLLAPGDLAFDIGAHVGNRSRALLAAGARVVALEPNPLLFRFLKRSLRGNGVTLLQSAVGAAMGSLELAVSSRHPTVSSLAPGWIAAVGSSDGFRHVRWDRRIMVEVTTLDRLVATYGRPQFVKIDVEGMEAAILAGLSQPLPLIAFEYLVPAIDLAIACIARLEGLGSYRFNHVDGEGQQFARGDWVDGRAMRLALRSLPASARHGDLYARLEAS
ncbi:FkbM family methyltransferase [Oleomonas cavernae]|uniref:FkbM family methyltransferase n=1 Tax=Oleomonas cavernae TaxID=2320859 RepID=A0A418WC38_9PROT|nr:FkbM family methyltransferase [Oleomonas cavernae]RJF87603.1 FkbM family methyltransferase [Oleomonas cavernae]